MTSLNVPPWMPPMPPPTMGGMIFNLAMMACPFAGLGAGYVIAGKPGGTIGLFAGIAIACTGWTWFFITKPRRGMHCEVCGRPLSEGTISPSFIPGMGVMFSTDGLQSGREGLGDKCVKCGRIFCTNCCREGARCKCGSVQFQTVRLLYG